MGKGCLVIEEWMKIKKLCTIAVNCMWDGLLGDENFG